MSLDFLSWMDTADTTGRRVSGVERGVWAVTRRMYR